MSNYFPGYTAECAIPIKCSRCDREVAPAGRDVSPLMNLPDCCHDAQRSPENTRHIWNVKELGDEE